MSLEALNVTSAHGNVGTIHMSCYLLSGCKIDRITNLKTLAENYLKELSRAFFDKHTMRTKNWCLFMFYSLYIHSWARKIFINLDRNFGSRTGARRPSILAPCSEIVYCKLEWFQPAEIKSYAGILGLWRGTYG